jgi:hypothetical protein
MFLIETEGIEGTGGANNEEQPEGDGNDEGLSTPHDRGNVVPDTTEGHQDTVAGDQDRQV